jgi:hypothetical protein
MMVLLLLGLMALDDLFRSFDRLPDIFRYVPGTNPRS